jgi:hypothetical protein
VLQPCLLDRIDTCSTPDGSKKAPTDALGRGAEQLRNSRSSSAWRRPFDATQAPPDRAVVPSQREIRPPASGMIVNMGAMSHTCRSGSTIASMRPVATSR